jgi:hypothetical protein
MSSTSKKLFFITASGGVGDTAGQYVKKARVSAAGRYTNNGILVEACWLK